MSLYDQKDDQKDDKKGKSYQHKSKAGKYAPHSPGSSAGPPENEGENTKPQEIAFRDMTFRQQYNYILRYGSGFKWHEGQRVGETLYNSSVHDENKNQHPKQQGRAFNDMTLVQKLVWSFRLGNAVGDALPEPRWSEKEFEATLRMQDKRSTTQHPVNEHGRPTGEPPASRSYTSASPPSLFLRPGERPSAPPLAPGRMNTLHHYLLTKQTHGAEPTQVESGSLFLPGAGAASIRPSDVTPEQDEKIPEYSQLMKMSPKDYLSAMNKKHGTSIGLGKRISIFDEYEKSVYITTMLENKDNKISKVFYAPYRDYPQALVDDLELYRNRNDIPQQTFTTQVSPSVDLGNTDLIQQELTDFLNVMEAYDETRGNLTEINQRLQRHELADTADDSWTTIKKTAEAIQKEWLISTKTRNLTETLQLYDWMIDELSNQLNALTHTGTHTEVRHLRNSITMLTAEKYKQQELSEDIENIINYLGNHTVTVSDDPRIAINQALVLVYKIADPKKPARMLHKINFTDKEIIQDAHKTRTTYRQRDPEMASWLDERQLKIFYIITKWKEWSGGRAQSSASVDDFYEYASVKSNAPPSVEQIVKHFEKSVASPAHDYTSVADLKGVSYFSNDEEFYSNINNYKRHDAKNEAVDALHYLVDLAGLYPLDLDKPLKKIVFLNVDVPAFGLTFLTLHHVLHTGDRNRWVKAEGLLCLFQTDSDDYWILSTIQNMLTLKKITQHNFMRFSQALSQESEVRAFLREIPGLQSMLPKPETKTKGVIGNQERRYYETKITTVDDITATTPLSDVLVRMSTQAFQGLAEAKKEFKFTERFEKPTDFGTWNIVKQTEWYLENLRKTAGDFFKALFKPLEMLSLWLDDEDYNPSDEDWAELVFDVLSTLMTLGISAASAGVKVNKAFASMIKSARAQGLKGPAIKKYIFAALRPELRKAAGSIGRELVGEVFPVIDWASFISSVGKSSYSKIRHSKTFNLDSNIAPPGKLNSVPGHSLPKKPGYYRDSPVIAEGTAAKIYDTQDGYLIKEYKRELKDAPIIIPSGADPMIPRKGGSFSGSLAEAARNRDAFNRLYGEGSASLFIIDGKNPFVKIVYVKMKKIQGSSLSSLLDKADGKEISMVENILNTPDKLTSEVNIILNRLTINGIKHYDINLGNIIFDPKLKEFQLIDFDRASINPVVNGKIESLSEIQIGAMRSKLVADFNEFLRSAKKTKRVSKAEIIFGQDASFNEIVPNTGIYKLRSHGSFANTGHFSGVQTANKIGTLLDKKPIIRLELESCFGGFGGRYSNAQIIANELNIPVKAYTGKVSEYSKQKNPNNFVLKQPTGNDAEKISMIGVNEKMFGISERLLSIRRTFNSLKRHRSGRDDVNTQLENIARNQNQTLSDDMWLTACFEEIITMPGLLAQVELTELGD